MLHIAIVGAGGFGREVLAVLQEQVARTAALQGASICFVDDAKAGQRSNDVDVLDAAAYANLGADRQFVIAISSSEAREREAVRLLAGGATPFTVVAANAIVSGHGSLGEGAIMSPFTIVSPNASIGRYFHCNYHSYVAHDCVIGDFVTFAPGVKCNGGVVIEDHAYIGTGAIIKQAQPGRPVVIGRGAVVGMGAVVTKSVAPGVTVVGNPARPLGSA